ncbi:acyltransferase family protein [Delftia acidovorans]|uniref:acyltransferase family protein n=1 Tax=Delftia acidovorans TaxID=80866 RepID=UPI003C2DDE40
MLYSIQTLRAIAAWIVVAHHYVQAHGFSQKTPYFAFLSNYGAIGVDIFFIISGFVVYNSARKNTASPLNFAIHRAARIIPIYWLCTFITALLFIFFAKIHTIY